ncbi:MAG TPA: tRNA preQ1(34) S-adenosylmethionine ribosyltransferase-isomerase QueA [Hypericibacter adhaerens]|jgi:S-adenosylmethionine:tRNA ribosyltransferase-isomerase|uniref:tRNA preQ1(34) S-adenosylmethionine ribosyltransferase-isomerase QueA n=1 Tax=Hypericibacter adhaerens TaxID=2602016 RepID=UPI002C913137|nr:tRNA preQ1(34) S-adenosylmethionine ribosyltransferase-isomerase QueA [Hypericibacter adhaerens]HWA42979.1 tRNA preQ1(34) S-adenosylmethionine ribosyltransferase-isomerase QueA [Hypericibacter adhaerens]
MRTADFDFELPPERIADRPASPRDAARLLVVRQNGLEDRIFRELPALLAPDDLLVVNDTRVIPARIEGRRGAAHIEATLHKAEGLDRWRAFARPAKRLKPGDVIEIAGDFRAEVLAKGEAGEVTLKFSAAGADLIAALHRHGHMPLPPYIRRPEGELASDREDYQTIFARAEGAVAAPTAALHFTPALLAALAATGIAIARVTLHVGAGTFLPVKVDNIEEHRMHAEWGEVGADAVAAVDRAKAKGGRIVAVGTTSLRLLETAAAADGTLAPFSGDTALFITPGYRFKLVDRLITNFHLPRSTLFMLVAAFAGLERMKRAYAHAIERGYRFYSYGDACFLEPDRG